MKYTYKPQGVCARSFEFEIENKIIKDVKIIGGCPGNLLGISMLIKNKNIDDVISSLEGIKCGPKATSCPDQISKALKSFDLN